jgi:hypothetical protein
MMRNRLFVVLLLLLSCAALCFGCGGGSSPADSKQVATPGSLAFEIVWPEPSRVIPAAAKSLVIQVSGPSLPTVKKVIPRPPAGTNTTSTRFDSLPPGIVGVLVQAFPNADGTGVVQAVGGTTVAIVSDVTTQAKIDLTSTVDHIDLTPNPLVIIPNRPAQLAVAPRDANNALVLVAPSSLQWTSNLPGVATVDANGVVTGLTLGIANVRVVDSESGQSAAAQVHVVAPIAISPSQATVSIGDKVQFTATVTGLANTAVTWSIVEAPAGGTITNTGLYTAPGQAGAFHVRATSAADPSIFATALVNVQAGSGTVIIQ